VGLDLVVERCAKPGHETEWHRLVERSFSGEGLSKAETARFNDISVPGYERIGAPRIGIDAAADAYVIEACKGQTSKQVAATLRKFSGHYVSRLVACDGVPAYSNCGAYDGIDGTSFRGQFLRDCTKVIDEPLLHAAWDHKLPEAAIAYGRALLAAADAAETSATKAHRSSSSRRGRAKSAKSPPSVPLPEQLDIVRAAGRWYVFWGERGHPIRAYF